MGPLLATVLEPTRADRWVANTKHWCRYCKIYIQDNKATRSIHENGKKHKENVAQFLRDIDKKSRADLEQEKEMQRQLALIEEAATRQYNQDLQGNHPAASTTAPVATPVLPRTAFPASRSARLSHKSFPKASASPRVRSPITEPKALTAAEAMVTPGAWELVDKPDSRAESAADPIAKMPSSATAQALPSAPSQAPMTKSPAATAAHDNDSDPEELIGFRIREKQLPEAVTLPLPGADTSPGITSSNMMADGLFKRRKAGGQAKQRKLRTKK
ncbi:WW domain binding protein 4 [Dimargaris xerosporica]|nr:WW domain binding protein 4 [Dimargaris xerosporica]